MIFIQIQEPFMPLIPDDTLTRGRGGLPDCISSGLLIRSYTDLGQGVLREVRRVKTGNEGRVKLYF